MKNRNLYATLPALLLAALIAGCSAMTPTEPGASIGGATQLAKAPAGGPSEGIKVHGHWVIEVRNSDGTLASRNEFDNALGINGVETLSQLFARQLSLGLWRVVVQASGILCGTSPACIIGENGDSLQGDNNFFKTLTVALLNNAVVLKGSATVSANGKILAVATAVSVCSANTAPATPCGSPPETLTATGLFPNVVSVVAGQQVQVTVTLSFG